jgi:NodT family efflux transporter outer membrane factor (OMF) lipoprotein
VQIARAALFPVATTSPAITVARSSSSNGNGGSTATGGAVFSGSGIRRLYNLPVNVSWEPDLWGNIRRGVTAGKDSAESFAAQVENAKLLYQAELAQDYFELHGNDGDAELLRRTVASYQEYLTLTRNRFAGGVASDLDVAQAESQLYNAQSALIDLDVQRTQLEHAIAILIGKAPAELTIPPVALTTDPPPVPVGLPSQLLERRPDIAASERRVAAANEQIGIAMAAFFPTLSLTGSGGFQASSLAKWFTWPSRFWSVGPGLAETLFDGGRRRATVAEQRAAYDATVAQYRETVLTAMQQVEDNLAALRVLEKEAAKVDETIGAAERALTISTAQYRAGTVNYLNVIIEQAALLNAQRTAVSLRTRRLSASVLLIEAIGGKTQ